MALALDPKAKWFWKNGCETSGERPLRGQANNGHGADGNGAGLRRALRTYENRKIGCKPITVMANNGVGELKALLWN